jgi:TRAP-type uncharacterized transport system substrate-binding protein
MPARTYAGQAEPVQTLAATGLMITRSDVPAQQVDAVLKLLFEPGIGQGAEGSAAALIGVSTARAGVLIPWFPAAEAFLAKAPTVPSR